MPTPAERLRELFAKVDDFFARAHAQLGAEMACAAGCSDCCKKRFSVTALEAEAVAAAVAALPEAVAAAMAARARGAGEACPALEADGRCAVYAARPLICRTHGLPLRFGPAPVAGSRHLPVAQKPDEPALDACPKNFVGRDLATLPREHVLDQVTLSTILGALDAAWAREHGRPAGERVELAVTMAGLRTTPGPRAPT
jgi:hypothetical protein